MDKTNSFQSLLSLLNGTASEEEIQLLKQLLASGEISIGGNVNQSVIIVGSGNTVELTPEALDLLNARHLLGNLDRDLTGSEIASGLDRLESELPLRAPVLLIPFQEQNRRLRYSLQTSLESLSNSARRERVEALAAINSLCMETLDISFNSLCLGEKPPEYDSRSPFRGLESFRPEDSRFFFGREELTRILVRKINAHPFLAVLGASGSGKSSLVMAGLIPALGLEYSIFCPGTDPLAALVAAMSSVKENALIVVDQFEELFTLTRDEDARLEFIARLLDAVNRYRIILTLRSDFLGEVAAYRILNEKVQNHLENIPPMNKDELRRAMEGQTAQVGLRFEADLSQQIMDDVEGEPGAMPLLQHALWELWNRRHGRWLRASEYRAFGGVKQAITSTAEKVYGECTKAEQEQIRDIFLRLTRLDESDAGRDTSRRVPFNDLIPSDVDYRSSNLLLNKLANARLVVKTVNQNRTEVEVAHEALIRYWERLRAWLNEDRSNLSLLESISEAARHWETARRDDAFLNHRGGRLDDALFLGSNSRYGLTVTEQAYLKACVEYQKREQSRRERLRRQITIGLGIGFAIMLAIAIFAARQWQRAEDQTNIALERTGELQSLSIAAQADKLLVDHNPDLAIALDLYATQQKNPPEKAYASLLDAAYITLSRKAYSVCQPKGDPASWVTVVDISRDDKVLAVGCSHDKSSNIYVLDISTGAILAEMDYTAWLHDLAFSPDGKFILTGYSDNKALLWSSSGELIHTLEEHSNAVSAVAFSPDGTMALTGSYDKTVILWDVVTGEVLQHIIGSVEEEFPGKFTSVDFDPRGKQAVLGDDDGNVIVWDYEAGYLYYSFDKHSNFVLSVRFSPDGSKIISSSADSTIMIWSMGSSLNRESVIDVSKFYPGVWVNNAEYFHNDSQILMALSNGLVLLWDVQSLQVVQSLEGHLAEVEGLSISSDGQFAASGARDGTARLWNLQMLSSAVNMSGENFETNSMVILGDDPLLFGGTAGGYVNVWDTQSGTLVDSWQAYPKPATVSEIALSPKENILLTVGSNGTAILWDLKTHQPLWQFSKNGDNARSVDISPDNGRAIIGYVSGAITLIDLSTGNPICTLTGHTNAVNSVRFSPDGKTAVSGSNDYKVILWDVSRCQEEKALFQQDGWVMAIRFSPDGNLLASASADQTIALWNIATGQQVYRLRLPDMAVNPGLDPFVLTLDFSPDGRLLSSGYANGNVAIWSVKNGILLRKYIVDPKDTCRYGTRCFWILSTRFGPTGDTLWASASDGQIYAWHIIPVSTPEGLKEWLRENLYIRELTDQEKSAYEIGQ